MKSRLLVAAVGVPLVYYVTWESWQQHLLFALVIAAVSVVACAEFYQLVGDTKPFVPAGLLPALATPLLAWKAVEPGIVMGVMLTLPLILIFFSISVRRRDAVAAVATTLMPVSYIAVALSLMVVIRQSPYGFDLILLLLAGTWLTDTGAYFGGRAFGRHKLAPRLSPNKTVEGFVCGTVLGTLVVWYGHFLTQPPLVGASNHWLSGWDAFAIGLAVSLATPVGDLFESMLKRAAGVKDTGRLLGEHGGILDRIDALLLSAPAMYLMAFYVGAL